MMRRGIALPFRLLLALVAGSMPLVQAQAFAGANLSGVPAKVSVEKNTQPAAFVEKATNLSSGEPFLVEESESKEKEFERRFNFELEFLVLDFNPVVAKPTYSSSEQNFPRLCVLRSVQLRFLHTSLSPPLA